MMVSGPNSLVSMAHLCGMAATATAALGDDADDDDAGLPRVWIRAGYDAGSFFPAAAIVG